MNRFEQYWDKVRAEYQTHKEAGLVEWEIIPRNELADVRRRCWQIDWLRFSSVDDQVVWGWIATPQDHHCNGAAMLWLPGYSYGTPPPDNTNLVEGMVTLCINVHGNHPDEPYTNPAGKNDYITNGLEDADKSIYRKIVIHAMNAMDVLSEQDRVDPERLVVGGMSQGGALALIIAANHDLPKMCFADMPFLCSIPLALKLSSSPAYKAVRIFMDQNRHIAHAAMENLQLFDPLQHAPQIKIPTYISAGGKDPASRWETIPPVYEKIGSNIKEYRFYPRDGHVFLPEMVETYQRWVKSLIIDGLLAKTDPFPGE